MKAMQVFIHEWFNVNTFTPRWFPQILRKPIGAFGFGVLIQFVAILCTSLILNFVPDFSFRGALIIVGVVVTALTVGGGPGLIASFTGTLMLQFFLIPPVFSFSVNKGSDMLAVVFYLFVCLSTNLAASHVEHIHHRNQEQGVSPSQTLLLEKTASFHQETLENRVSLTEKRLEQLAQAVSRQSIEVRATITTSQQIILAKIDELAQLSSKKMQ